MSFFNGKNSRNSVVFEGAERVDIGLPYYQPCRTKEVRKRRQVMKENKKNVELERASRLRTCKLTSVSNKFSCRSVLVPCGNRFLVVHQLRSLWIKCRKLGRRQPGRFMLKDLRTTMGSSEISSPWLIFYLRLHSRSATARITALMCTMGIN